MQRAFNRFALTDLREAALLSITELARKASISQNYLSEIELGKKNPSGKVARSLADALGCNPLSLFCAPEQVTSKRVRVG